MGLKLSKLLAPKNSLSYCLYKHCTFLSFEHSTATHRKCSIGLPKQGYENKINWSAIAAYCNPDNLDQPDSFQLQHLCHATASARVQMAYIMLISNTAFNTVVDSSPDTVCVQSAAFCIQHFVYLPSIIQKASLHVIPLQIYQLPSSRASEETSHFLL